MKNIKWKDIKRISKELKRPELFKIYIWEIWIEANRNYKKSMIVSTSKIKIIIIIEKLSKTFCERRIEDAWLLGKNFIKNINIRKPRS